MYQKITFLKVTILVSVLLAGTAQAQSAASNMKDGSVLSKAHFGLRQLHEEYQAHVGRVALGATAQPFTSSQSGIRLIGDSVAVDIVASSPGSLRVRLASLGMKNVSVYKNVLSGILPLDKIDDASALTELISVRPVLAMTHVGSVTSQGDPAMMTDVVRSTWNVDGTGVQIGTLSDTYNALGGAAADVATSDLPTGVTVLSDLASGSDEGRAMMQLIHDVAPGADQAFHTAFSGQADFAQGIEELAGCPAGSSAGCTPVAGVAADVIVDDVFYFAEPMFQDGIIAQAVDTVKAAGVAYFSSAGNGARQSYESAFAPSGMLDPNGGNLHAFGAGDAFQSVIIPVGETVTIVLQWDQPFFSVSGAPGSNNDVDLWLFDSAATTVVASSTTGNIGGDPVEIIQFSNAGPNVVFNIGISHFTAGGGAQPGLLKYVYYGSMIITEYNTLSSTIVGHANALGAAAVGASAYFATPVFGVSPPILESFSSSGPTNILFDTLGNTNLSLRDKPNFVAPDGTDNTFFGSDVEPNGFPNFFGTSAAAPHAAAAAALLLECDENLTPDDINNQLAMTAIEMDVAGFDDNTGAGLIDVAAAANMACIGGVRYDHNADGKADLAWRNINDGRNTLWFMDGETKTASGLPKVTNSNWQIKAIGDTDGDGRSDLIWRNILDGRNQIWKITDTGKQTGSIATISDLDWQLAGADDFDGNGTDDILWRNSADGRNTIYFMDGFNATSTSISSISNLAWIVADTGDLNGDGKADILWRNQTSGANVVWLMDGATNTSNSLTTIADLNWQVQGIGDLNADGFDDVVWRNSVTRAVDAWLVEAGLSINQQNITASSGSNFQIELVGDVGGDGKADIIWRDQVNGTNLAWEMDGVVRTPGLIQKVGDTDWNIMP